MSGKTAATEPIPLPLAARLAGVPARTLRNWVSTGKLAAIRGQRGWLVRLGDIEQIAAMIGSHAATSGMAAGMAAEVADEVAATVEDDRERAAIAASVTAIAATERQAQGEALIQQIIAPFVAEQTRLAEALGRVQAERDTQAETIAELRRRAEVAEAELSRRRDKERAQAAQEGAGAPKGASADAPSPEPSTGFWARLRRLFGGGGG